jgi:phage baseplate assembly protein W
MARRAFAQEDNNINTASVTTSRTKQYTDIDLSFTAKPSSGEIFKKTDAAAVKQSVKTLVMCNKLEKPFRPDFGGDVRAQLFELAYKGKDALLRDRIINTIQFYEPRAEVLDLIIDLQSDYNSLSVTLKFKVVNTEEQVEFTSTLSRLR